MNAHLKLPVVAQLFLVPWGLVSTWALVVWFCRIYERGFKYNPYILQFEFGWSRLLLIVFGGMGLVIYERSRAEIHGWTKALYLFLITLAVSVLVLDLIVSKQVTPAP